MSSDFTTFKHRFREIVTSEDEIRAVVGYPPQRSMAKVINSIDEYSKRFIAHAPFVFIASAGADGSIDISPKGDPAGFVRVIDQKTRMQTWLNRSKRFKPSSKEVIASGCIKSSGISR